MCATATAPLVSSSYPCGNSPLLEGVDTPKSELHAFVPSAAITTRSVSHSTKMFSSSNKRSPACPPSHPPLGPVVGGRDTS